jgi:predicted DNA-binding ribbon-helix-helix protein
VNGADHETVGMQNDAAVSENSTASVRVVKHSIVIAGHRTSVSLEDAFWRALKEIAREENLSLAALVAQVDAGRGAANLSSALRVFVLTRALEAGKARGALPSR